MFTRLATFLVVAALASVYATASHVNCSPSTRWIATLVPLSAPLPRTLAFVEHFEQGC